MIIFPCTSLYDAKFPQLEDNEEEIFYRHPFHPLKVNQLGIIYFDDDAVYSEHATSGGYAYWVNSLKKYFYTGMKIKCIWECYHNQILTKHTRFKLLDANPFNLTKENIVTKDSIVNTRTVIKKEDSFIAKTIQWMENREDWCQRKGIETDIFWDAIGFSMFTKSQIKSWKIRFKKIQKLKRWDSY